MKIHALLRRYANNDPINNWCLLHLSTFFGSWSIARRWQCLSSLDNPGVFVNKAKRINSVKQTKKRKTCHDCPACKSSDIELSQLQTRGGDESMTSYFYCRTCEHRWKEN